MTSFKITGPLCGPDIYADIQLTLTRQDAKALLRLLKERADTASLTELCLRLEKLINLRRTNEHTNRA